MEPTGWKYNLYRDTNTGEWVIEAAALWDSAKPEHRCDWVAVYRGKSEQVAQELYDSYVQQAKEGNDDE